MNGPTMRAMFCESRSCDSTRVRSSKVVICDIAPDLSSPVPYARYKICNPSIQPVAGHRAIQM